MAHLLAAREALDRFVAELASSSHGAGAARLHRAAAITRALIEDALTTPAAASTWVDHNLAVVVASGLDDPGSTAAASTLFGGVRRRLADALASDPDDLILALALARGITAAKHDARLAETMVAVANGVANPHAGPRLVSATVAMIVAARNSKVDEVKKTAADLAARVKDALDRVAQRLPKHPGLALDQVQLAVLAASATKGDERSKLLGQARGLLGDHEGEFGDSARARGLRSEILSHLARSGGSAADIRREALQLLQAGASDRSLDAKTAERLVRAVERAGGMDNRTAARLSELFEGYLHDDRAGAGGRSKTWRKVFGTLLQHSGDQAGLVAHWERSLMDDPKNAEAAKGLAGRLMRNLRGSLKAPFSSAVLDRVLDALPFGAMAKWSADDARMVLDAVDETLGTARAAAFARDRLLAVRELKGKMAIHDRGLELFKALGDDDATLEFARQAAQKVNHGRSRLLVAETLLERGERLDEAESILVPLLDVRGRIGKSAQALKQRLARHPSLRSSHKAALIAFEERIGIQTGAPQEMRIVFIGPNYALAEAFRHKAPDFYEHKHLRTMLRGEDLPKGIGPSDLRKGDRFKAPLSGQDANPNRDKSGLRVYWIADSSALELAMDAAAIDARWAAEEAAFGIGGAGPLALKVAWDGRKKRLTVRAFRSDGGGHEFPIRPEMTAEQLPDNLEPQRLGKSGKRFWGRVERKSGRERAYVVVGGVDPKPPSAGAEPGTQAPTQTAAAAEPGTQAPTQTAAAAEPGTQAPTQTAAAAEPDTQAPTQAAAAAATPPPAEQPAPTPATTPEAAASVAPAPTPSAPTADAVAGAGTLEPESQDAPGGPEGTADFAQEGAPS